MAISKTHCRASPVADNNNTLGTLTNNHLHTEGDTCDIGIDNLHMAEKG